jgi:hypothetical protein
VSPERIKRMLGKHDPNLLCLAVRLLRSRGLDSGPDEAM